MIMTRVITLILYFIFIGNLFSQIYVKDNTYIYNKGSLVYSKGNLELNGANSLFYLRNLGQFLQGTTSTSSNKGIGKLSVYQEGTVNNFAYNYWCSPVGNASASVGNEDFGITMLQLPSTNITSITPTITGGYNGISSNGGLTISSYWIWKFLSSSTYSNWIQSGATSNISAGQGFTMKGTSGSDTTNPGETAVNNPGSAQRYDFQGKPNDGTITITVATNKFTLTGNPYPSAIDLNSFLTDSGNSAIDGTAMFWEQDKTVNSHNIAQYRGGYGVYNGTTSVYTPATFYTYDVFGVQGSVFSNPNANYKRRFTPIGQGFMVRGASNGTVQMKNSYRIFVKEGVANNSQFERLNSNSTNQDYGYFDAIPNLAGIDYTQISKAPTPHLVINASLSGQAVRQLALCFLPNAIDGVDLADSKSPDAGQNLPMDMYFWLDNTEYVHSTTSFDLDKKFPVGFKNTQDAIFTIKVNEFVNIDGIDNVYLHDKLTDMYYDIKENTFSLSLPAGLYNDRFEITFKNYYLSNNSNVKSNFTIVQNNQNQQLTIFNPNKLEIKSVRLFDVLGKKIFDENNLSIQDSYQFSTANLSTAVYIVEVTSNDSIKTGQKIIITKN